MAFKVLSVVVFSILSFNLHAAEVAPALSPQDLAVKSFTLPDSIKIESAVINGQPVNIVIFSATERVVLPATPKGRVEREIFETLTEAEKKLLNEDRKAILRSVIQAAQYGMLKSATVIQGNEARVLTLTDKMRVELLAEKDLKLADPIGEALQIPGPQSLRLHGRVSARFKRFLVVFNEAVFTSALKALRSHRDSVRQIPYSRVREIGFSIALKSELQFGLRGLNVTQNNSIVLSIGYNRDHRAIMLRVGKRNEKMSAGTALSAGFKVELRNFRLTSTNDSDRVLVEGITWYPPSIPVAGFVADSGPQYVSEGLVFGLNAADLIPGAFLVNTVNTFSENQRVYRLMTLPTGYMHRLRNAMPTMNRRPSGRAATCQAVFASARI